MKPLADVLMKFNLKIWYDELSLKLGDSLSKSIDKGLMDSRYGLLIISQNFLNKKWPDYEYRSLLQKEINGEKVLLPIWLNIEKNDIERYSLFLSDKYAVKASNLSVNQIGLKILEVIDHDKYENLKRYMMYESLVKNAELQEVPLTQIHVSDIRHETLSQSILNRSTLAFSIIGRYFDKSEEEFIDNLKRDLYPHKEIQTWEIMASVLIEYTDKHLTLEESQKTDIVHQILGFSIGKMIKTNLNETEIIDLYEMWKKRFHK